MKTDLKRIEAALHQVADRDVSSNPIPLPHRSLPLNRAVVEETPEVLCPSDMGGEKDSNGATPVLPVLRSPDSPATTAITAPDARITPLTNDLAELKAPTLPRLKTPSLSSHRNVANPSLALSLLKELETTVVTWQEELQLVLRQIQDIYMEGPIVDGWLESYAHQNGEDPTFRHADVDCLMDYIEKMRNASPPSPPVVPQSADASAGYRLCGLNEDGQLWFRHCPAEQVPEVGLAIARYQRLRILLSRKQHIETRLSHLAQTLIGLHGQLHSGDGGEEWRVGR
jgi:hypothetical protein